MLFDLEVDVVSGGERQDLALKGILIAVEPLGSGDKGIVFLQLLVEVVLSALLADGDDVAGTDGVGRNVDALAVDGEVAVVDKLSGLTAGVCKAETVDDVVQTALDQAQQNLTGVAAGTGSLLRMP